MKPSTRSAQNSTETDRRSIDDEEHPLLFTVDEAVIAPAIAPIIELLLGAHRCDSPSCMRVDSSDK